MVQVVDVVVDDGIDDEELLLFTVFDCGRIQALVVRDSCCFVTELFF